jgi:hypothetical protein
MAERRLARFAAAWWRISPVAQPHRRNLRPFEWPVDCNFEIAPA